MATKESGGPPMKLLPELYVPMKVGRMTVSNRLMMAGMSAGTNFDDHGPNDDMIAYYVERARGEPGMMAIGATAVVPPRPGEPRRLGLYTDDIIPSMRRLVDAVHQYPTKFGIQL